MEKITPTLPRLFLLHALTLLLVYSPLQAYQAQFPLLATGYYFDGEVRRALMIQSLDGGISWQYAASAQVSLPQAELGNGFFRTVTCHENSCIASGDYTIDSAYYPLLALSLDGGITWDFPASIMDPHVLPANFVNGHF